MKYVWLAKTSILPDINQYAPFKALLSVDESVSAERQRQVSTWLVEMGSMHVTIRGEDCLSWKNSIRRANLGMVSLDEMQPEQFVMITAHPYEGLRSVFKQLRKYAKHTHLDLDFTLIVHLAKQSGEVEYLSVFSRL